MPTYEYECQTCHERVEAVQKFTDPSLTMCPNCGGELRKVFSAVGIVFKGSGFYKNDSRGAKTTSAPSSTTSDTTTTAPSGDTSSAPAPAATPAPSTKTESTSTTASSSSD